MTIGVLDNAELKEKKLGYVRENRHFINVPLTKNNCQYMIPSKEKRELLLIRMELLSCSYNPDYFEVVKISEINLKYQSYYIYVICDTRTDKGCGMFVEDSQVKCIKLKGYNFTDPYGKGKDWICRDVNSAIAKTGKIKKLFN